jgi:glycosyltransferase involved in cell wall biosynthesis
MEEILPLITICMPIKNRLWSLKDVLNSLEKLYYPKHRLKLVFVDDFSTDGSYEFLITWTNNQSTNFYKIEVVRARSNIPRARNICIDRMEGDYLLYWDSDVIPPPELLLNMVKLMEKNQKIGVIGADYTYDPSLGLEYIPTVNKETNAVYMGFTLIRKDVFKIVGKFNELLSVGEDTEFSIRVKERSSYKIYWAPKSVIHLRRHVDVAKPGALRSWLKFNFMIRAREYYLSWKSLPRFLRLRVFYWILWPWILVMLAYAFLRGEIIATPFLLLYIFTSAWFVIKQKGIVKGFKLWVKGNVPTGLALSYGIFILIFKDFIRRRHFR